MRPQFCNRKENLHNSMKKANCGWNITGLIRIVVTDKIVPVLSSERASHIKKLSNNKHPVVSPRWVPDTKRTWPTDSRWHNFSYREVSQSWEAKKRQPSARGYNWATQFLGYLNTETWPSRIGESKTRQQNMVVSSAGLGPESDCSGKAQRQLYK
jgi:hypothetical protein